MTHLKTLSQTTLFVLLIAALLLGGCGGDQATPAATEAAVTEAAATDAAQATTDATAEATEATAESAVVETDSPLAAPDSPLAAANSPLPTPATKAEPTSDTGAIVGRILVVKPDAEIAVADMIIGLAEVIRDENGVPRVGGYAPSRTVRVTTDPYGRFVMNDVKPGEYTLILDAVVQQYQLADEKTGYTIMAEVKAGEITDLGTLEYSSLPVPGFS